MRFYILWQIKYKFSFSGNQLFTCPWSYLYLLCVKTYLILLTKILNQNVIKFSFTYQKKYPKSKSENYLNSIGTCKVFSSENLCCFVLSLNNYLLLVVDAIQCWEKQVKNSRIIKLFIYFFNFIFQLTVLCSSLRILCLNFLLAIQVNLLCIRKSLNNKYIWLIYVFDYIVN